MASKVDAMSQLLRRAASSARSSYNSNVLIEADNAFSA